MDRTLLLLLIGLFLFVSPLTDIWSAANAPWYLPYLLWGGFIAAIALLRPRGDDDEL